MENDPWKVGFFEERTYVLVTWQQATDRDRPADNGCEFHHNRLNDYYSEVVSIPIVY